MMALVGSRTALNGPPLFVVLTPIISCQEGKPANGAQTVVKTLGAVPSDSPFARCNGPAFKIYLP